MAEVILQTKLFIPPRRDGLVPRPHLIEKLQKGFGGKLTIVAAPAGFGKTTLLADWLAQAQEPAGWLSLDEDDNDIGRFFTYVGAAVRPVARSGHSLQDLLKLSQAASVKALSTALINDCATAQAPFILVLDDYHLINEADIHEAMSFILDNLPPQLRLVIASRTDPLLPLPRLRARGQLTEIRTDDLRFSASESASFLEDVASMRISPQQLQALENRTEGWAAGLQMAALSMQGLAGEAEISTFINAFTASHRFIFDYLVDEVLHQRPAQTRSFLLQTSLLDRFNASLCSAVTGNPESQAILEALEKANLFLFPLDSNRQWYRYHHLFAELLRHRLTQNNPAQVPDLHQRASLWYEGNGFAEQAIHHALEGELMTRAAQLCERYGAHWLAQSRLHKAKRWLDALPSNLIHGRPALAIMYAWILALTNQLDAIEPILAAAEAALQAAEQDAAIYDEWDLVDPAQQTDTLKGHLATCRAVIARANGDIDGMIGHLEFALAALPEDALEQRGIALLYQGFARWMAGKLAAALNSFASSLAAGQASGRIYTAISATTAMGRMGIEMGTLHEAEACFQRGLQLATQYTEQTGSLTPVVAEAYTGLAKLAYERNNLAAASENVRLAIEMIEPLGVTEDLVDALLAQARIQWAMKLPQETALTLQRAAELVEAAHVAPALQKIVAAQRAWYWSRDPDLSAVNRARLDRWAQAQATELASREAVSLPRERELASYASWLIQAEDNSAALALLGQLERMVKQAGKTGRLIQLMLLQAQAHLAQNAPQKACDLLADCLNLAETAGFVRTLVDETSWLLPLLEQLPANGYRRRLIALCYEEVGVDPGRVLPYDNRRTDALSERELEVLQLLATHLSGPEIASRLHISQNTFKTHTKNIYSKLQVRSRNRAVVRARELGLLH